MTFVTMTTLQAQLFIFMLAGFILRRAGVITAEGKKSLSDLLIDFILPANIICSFQLDLSAELLTSCAAMLIISIVCQFVYLLVSRVIYPGAPRERLACLRYGTVCSNAGFLGLPIIGGVVGTMGTLLTSVALIPQRIVMWSAGLSLFTKTDGKSVIRKLATHPCIVAVFIGFALMLGGNPTFPDFIQKALSGASGCTTCLSMLVIGSILAEAKHINWKDKLMWWYVAVRLVIIPLIVFAALALLPVDPLVRTVMVLMSAMPAGSTTAILAARYDGDAPFASCLVFVTTLLSMVTLPLLCLFL